MSWNKINLLFNRHSSDKFSFCPFSMCTYHHRLSPLSLSLSLVFSVVEWDNFSELSIKPHKIINRQVKSTENRFLLWKTSQDYATSVCSTKEKHKELWIKYIETYFSFEMQIKFRKSPRGVGSFVMLLLLIFHLKWILQQKFFSSGISTWITFLGGVHENHK